MAVSLDDIILPADIQWVDRGQPGWSQNTERLVDGRLLIEETPYQGGIPITLASRDNFGWADMAQITAIQEKVVMGAEMTITDLTTSPIPVTWRLSDGYPFEYDYVQYPVDYYRITIRLITLES